MKRAALALAALLLLVACTSQQVQVSANLATVAGQYEPTRAALVRKIAAISDPQVAAEWQGVLSRADSLKADLEALYTTGLIPSVTDLALVYAQAAELHATATKLIAPELASLPLADQIRIRQFDTALRALASAYQSWRDSPTGAGQSEMFSSGLEVARLALQVGLMVL